MSKIGKSNFGVWVFDDFRLHPYDNTPIQYTASFFGCTNAYFQLKDLYIILTFAQNIDCGYTLEPPQFHCIKVGCNGV